MPGIKIGRCTDLLQVFPSACTNKQTATTVGSRQGQKNTGLGGLLADAANRPGDRTSADDQTWKP
jgi:hypothetical protein